MFLDFRCRPPTAPFLDIQDNDAFSGLIKQNGLPRFEPRPVDEWLAELEDAGLELGVVPGRDIETTFGFAVPNDHVAEIVARHPERLVGYGGIDPNKPDAADEVRRCALELGFAGISLDPYMHRSPLDSDLYRPLYELCIEHDLACYVTGGPGSHVPGTVIEDASPLAVDRVMRDHPELTLIMSHGAYPWVLEMIAVAMRWEGVFVEFSLYELLPGMENYVRAAEGPLRDKLIFASAEPFVPCLSAVERYDGLGFSPEAHEAVMRINGRRVLARGPARSMVEGDPGSTR